MTVGLSKVFILVQWAGMPGMPECNSKQLAMQQMQIQKEIKIYSKQEREVKSTTHTLT